MRDLLVGIMLLILSILEGEIQKNGLTNIVIGGGKAFRYVGASIQLPIGSWMIYYYTTYNNKANSNSTLWWDLSDSPTVHNFYGRVLSYTTVGAGLCVTYASYSVVNTVPKTYCIMVLYKLWFSQLYGIRYIVGFIDY